MSGRGLFVTFEGIEGSGKSTHARLIYEALREMGIEAVLTAEPGGTDIGRSIREVLLDPAHKGMDPVCELLLYNASRRQLVKELIEPSLREGKVVISDRYSDSTAAYQGAGRGLTAGLIETIDSVSTGGLKPGLTILLDLDVETGLKRNEVLNKTDRIELEAVEFHRLVREGFLRLRENEPGRIRLFDATATKEALHEEILTAVLGALGAR